jgi:hypothetical protein
MNIRSLEIMAVKKRQLHPSLSSHSTALKPLTEGDRVVSGGTT